jgi:hypothetical protein
MKMEISKVPFGRIVITGFSIIVLSLLIVTLVITGYALYLGFQARGAPDQERIGQFGQWLGSWLTPVLQVVLTFAGARWVRRKSETTRLSSGLVLGVVVILLAVLSQVLFGWSFQLIDILWFALIVVAGWLGGRPKVETTPS